MSELGKELHADYNAARNVGWRLVQHWLQSGAGRADCQVALNSRDGERERRVYACHVSWPGRESTDKPSLSGGYLTSHSTEKARRVSRLCSRLEIEDFRSRDDALGLEPFHLIPRQFTEV